MELHVLKLSGCEETGTSGHSDSVSLNVCYLLLWREEGGQERSLFNRQWLEVQFNHPGLGPVHPLGVKEEQFVTPAVIDAGWP